LFDFWYQFAILLCEQILSTEWNYSWCQSADIFWPNLLPVYRNFANILLIGNDTYQNISLNIIKMYVVFIFFFFFIKKCKLHIFHLEWYIIVWKNIIFFIYYVYPYTSIYLYICIKNSLLKNDYKYSHNLYPYLLLCLH